MAGAKKATIDPDKMNLSLNGCGYLGIYHVGVCSCIKKFYPQALRGKISGGSVGALVACAFMCDVPLDVCARYVFDVSMQVRNGILGPMSPDLDIMRVLRESMDAMLPQDAHLHCDGRMHASATRFDEGRNTLLSTFKSRDELLQALMCSCFIPIYCGYDPPKYYGVAYCDAALSNNSPWLNEDTVTVAPFSGNSDICPLSDGYFLKSLKLSNTSIGINARNMYMLFRVLFPASPEVQKDICQQGYNDALRFLRDNNLIPCENCKYTDSTPNHYLCDSPEGAMPIEISNEIEKAVEGFRKKLSYRLFERHPMKMLYYLNMPSIMTAKVAYVLISSIMQKVQMKAGLNVDEIWSTFLRVLKNGLYLSQNSKSKSIENRKSDVAPEVKEENEKLIEVDQSTPTEDDSPCVKLELSSDTILLSQEREEAEEIISSPAEVPKNNCSTKMESISFSMTSGQACQLELPHLDSNVSVNANEFRKTCVF